MSGAVRYTGPLKFVFEVEADSGQALYSYPCLKRGAGMFCICKKEMKVKACQNQEILILPYRA